MHTQKINIKNNIKKQILKINSTQSNKITIAGLAKTVGVTPDHLFKIIRGDRFPSMQLQFKIAQCLQCEVGDIFMPETCTEYIDKCV